MRAILATSLCLSIYHMYIVHTSTKFTYQDITDNVKSVVKKTCANLLNEHALGLAVKVYMDDADYVHPEDIIDQTVTGVNCASLLHGDITEVKRAEAIQSNRSSSVEYNSPEYWEKETQDCEDFKRRYGYITRPVSQEEAEFPLAFIILYYKDGGQVERLLRAIC